MNFTEILAITLAITIGSSAVVLVLSSVIIFFSEAFIFGVTDTVITNFFHGMILKLVDWIIEMGK